MGESSQYNLLLYSKHNSFGAYQVVKQITDYKKPTSFRFPKKRVFHLLNIPTVKHVTNQKVAGLLCSKIDCCDNQDKCPMNHEMAIAWAFDYRLSMIANMLYCWRKMCQNWEYYKKLNIGIAPVFGEFWCARKKFAGNRQISSLRPAQGGRPADNKSLEGEYLYFKGVLHQNFSF